MECKNNKPVTNEVRMMIRQGAISVKVGETASTVTNFPGVVALANLGEQLGVFDDLDDLLPRKERNRGLSSSAAAFDMMCIPLAGGACINDLAQLRQDEGLHQLLGRQVIPPSTAHDFLRRIRYSGMDALTKVNRRMLARVARQTKTTTATLDCDASLFTSTGANARMSYKGERGYMPMLAFWDELGMVIHEDFRNGNASPGSDALAFLQQTLAQLPEEVTHVYVRSDSAWYQAGLIDYCHTYGHGFCIGACQDEAVKKAIMGVQDHAWERIDLCSDPADPEPYVREWACETVHTLNESKHAYRLIIIRKERIQDDLFYGPYTYHAILTNMELALEEQIAWYRRRGQCEQRIGELKWDFELRVLPSGDFFVNATYLRLMVLAYNLFVALKTLVLPATFRSLRLKALRFQLLAIPALVMRHARRLWLKLPRGHPHAAAFANATA